MMGFTYQTIFGEFKNKQPRDIFEERSNEENAEKMLVPPRKPPRWKINSKKSRNLSQKSEDWPHWTSTMGVYFPKHPPGMMLKFLGSKMTYDGVYFPAPSPIMEKKQKLIC